MPYKNKESAINSVDTSISKTPSKKATRSIQPLSIRVQESVAGQADIKELVAPIPSPKHLRDPSDKENDPNSIQSITKSPDNYSSPKPKFGTAFGRRDKKTKSVVITQLTPKSTKDFQEKFPGYKPKGKVRIGNLYSPTSHNLISPHAKEGRSETGSPYINEGVVFGEKGYAASVFSKKPADLKQKFPSIRRKLDFQENSTAFPPQPKVVTYGPVKITKARLEKFRGTRKHAPSLKQLNEGMSAATKLILEYALLASGKTDLEYMAILEKNLPACEHTHPIAHMFGGKETVVAYKDANSDMLSEEESLVFAIKKDVVKHCILSVIVTMQPGTENVADKIEMISKFELLDGKHFSHKATFEAQPQIKPSISQPYVAYCFLRTKMEKARRDAEVESTPAVVNDAGQPHSSSPTPAVVHESAEIDALCLAIINEMNLKAPAEDVGEEALNSESAYLCACS